MKMDFQKIRERLGLHLPRNLSSDDKKLWYHK